MANNSTFIEYPTDGLNASNLTDGMDSSVMCGPPPGWTGIPPPGIYANISTILLNVILPVIILFGTFGNGLTVTVLFRQTRKLSSTDIFLLWLAVSDTLLLYTAPLRRWLISMWDLDVRHHGNIGCKLSVYLTYCSVQFSSWILVAVTIERMVSVVWPHRVRLGFTRRNSGICIILIFVIIFGLNIHILHGFGRSWLPVHSGQGICEPQYEGYYHFWSESYPYIDTAVAFAVPFVVIICSNSMIIYKLSQARSKRQEITTMAKKKGGTSHTEDSNSVNIMLIALGVLFFICMCPVSVYFIYLPYWEARLIPWVCIDAYEYFRLLEIRDLVFYIVTTLSYANASINFFLYVLSGSRFRSKIKALFLCRPDRSDSVFGQSSTYRSSRQRHTVCNEMSSIERQASGISKLPDEVATHESVGESLEQTNGKNTTESQHEVQDKKF